MSGAYTHRPVLLEEAIQGLAIRPDGVYVDGTLGRGGHSEAIVRGLTAGGRLLCIDRDSQALAGCVARLMDDPALLRRLGEGAKRSFEENYTGEIFAKHVEDVYRDVLKGVSHGTK